MIISWSKSLCPLSQAFGQFDAEGDGVVDIESMMIALKSSNGANLQGELSHVIRQLQACSLTPGRIGDLSTCAYQPKIIWICAHDSAVTSFHLLELLCSPQVLLTYSPEAKTVWEHMPLRFLNFCTEIVFPAVPYLSLF